MIIPTSATVNNTTYQIEMEIGRGQFGAVYLAKDPTNPSSKKVVKVSLNENSNLIEEAAIHNQMAEKLKIYSAPPVSIGADDIGNHCLIMDYCNEGSLDNFLRKLNLLIDNPDERTALLDEVLMQLRNIYITLASTSFLHRDIACRNILVNSEIDSQGHRKIKLMLSDFGHAIDLKGQQFCIVDPDAKIPIYTTPREAYLDQHAITRQTDQFAMQITMMEASVLLYGGSLTDIIKDEEYNIMSKGRFIARLKEQGDDEILALFARNTQQFIDTGYNLLQQYDITTNHVISTYHTGSHTDSGVSGDNTPLQLALSKSDEQLNLTVTFTQDYSEITIASHISQLMQQLDTLKQTLQPDADQALILKGIAAINRHLSKLQHETDTTKVTTSLEKAEKLLTTLSQFKNKAEKQQQIKLTNEGEYHTPRQPSKRR